jgi:hypothetical protein
MKMFLIFKYFKIAQTVSRWATDWTSRSVFLGFIHRPVSNKPKMIRHRTMDKAQKYASTNVNTPSSETYRSDLRTGRSEL